MPYKNVKQNKKYHKEYYLKNKDKILLSSAKRYKEKNSEIRLKNKEHYEKTKKLTGEGKGHGKGKEFKKGHIPWNKGTKGIMKAWNKGLSNWRTKKGTLEFIKAMKGRTPWNKGKPSLIKGERHYNWQGGISSINDVIRKSLDYRIWRRKVFDRDGFTCQVSGKCGVELVAHHIYNFADNPELRTVISNGITMTKKMHKLFHKIYGRKNNTKEQLEEFADELFFNPEKTVVIHS